jgi:acetolactate synthase-1/2/3 large subunit
MGLPDYSKIARAYGLDVFSVRSREELRPTISQALEMPGPTVCIVHASASQEVIPRQGFDRQADGGFRARPLEDMAPFLTREEFAEVMRIAPWNAT